MEKTGTNIFEKMSMIAAEIGTVAKNLEIEAGKNKYKAVSEADVLHAVKPIERKHGVFSYPCAREIVDSGEFITASTYKGERQERKQLFLRMKTVYRFVNIGNPSEFIEVTTYGDGLDSGDKATGKAMTYADKYALLKAYKIVTGDDPDQDASPELVQKVQRVEAQYIDNIKIEALVKKCVAEKVNGSKICKLYKVESFSKLTEKQFAHMVQNWDKVKALCS